MKDNTEQLLQDPIDLIQEVALGREDAKRQMMMQHLLSTVSFLSPVMTLSLMATGMISFSGMSFAIGSIFLIMSSKRAWDMHKLKQYELFFEPNHKLAMEFDDFLEGVVTPKSRLSEDFKQISKKMFQELSQMDRSLTQQDARKRYIAVYRKYMTQFAREVEHSGALIDDHSKEKFKRLYAQLKKVRLLG